MRDIKIKFDHCNLCYTFELLTVTHDIPFAEKVIKNISVLSFRIQFLFETL